MEESKLPMSWLHYLNYHHPLVQRTIPSWMRNCWWKVAIYGGALAGSGLMAFVALGLYLLNCGRLNRSPDSFACQELAFLSGLIAVVVMYGYGSLFEMSATLFISLKGALLIAGERERKTWDLLRLIPLTAEELLGYKCWGAYLSVIDLLHAANLVRLIALGGSAVMMGVGIDSLPSSVNQSLIDLSKHWRLISVAPLALVWFFVSPYWRALFDLCVAVAISSLTRSRGIAIALVIGAQVVLMPTLQIILFPMILRLIGISTQNEAIIALFAVGGITLGKDLIIMLLSLVIAVRGITSVE